SRPSASPTRTSAPTWCASWRACGRCGSRWKAARPSWPRSRPGCATSTSACGTCRTRCAPRKRPRTLAPNSSNWRARWPRAMASASATRMRSTAWPVRSSSRKSSTAEVFRPARQPSDVLVDPALALEAEEAGVLVLHARLPAAGGVEVADGDVALVPQRVVGQVVLLQVLPHVAVAPVGDRADLQAVAAPLQDRRVGAAGRLAAAQAGEPG